MDFYVEGEAPSSHAAERGEFDLMISDESERLRTVPSTSVNLHHTVPPEA